MCLKDPVLELLDFTLVAQERTLLTGFDCALRPRELTALLGPSGVGKSSLLRAANGLDDPQTGRILLSGKSPEDIGWTTFRRQVIYVSQRPALLDAPVVENLARPHRYRSARTITGHPSQGPSQPGFDPDEALGLMDALGLPESMLTQNALALSQGEQQRICLIRALLLWPKVLLLDEPTSALDDPNTQRVEALISQTAEDSGLAALIATHRTAQATDWCHRKIDLEPYMPEP